MKTQLKRLIFAAFLSASGFALTFFLYERSEPKRNFDSTEAPIASVSKVQNEIQRKPAKNFMWEQVFTGEQLYPGEAVRTSDNGEVRIQFEDGKFIDLEPESLVVLKRNAGEIALDLMEGSVFVNAKANAEEGASTSQLVLNSSNGKVDLSGATASLSKGSGSRLDVQVLEGSAQIKSKDGKTNTIESGKSGALGMNGLDFDRSQFQVQSPVPQTSLFVDPDNNIGTAFKWSGLPAQWKVSLYTGANRKELKPFANTAIAGATDLSAKLPLGKFFWKLVAQDASGKTMMESSIYKNEVLPRYAPTMIFPVADAKIPVEKAPYSMTFKWQKADDTNRVQLEIAKDPELKQKIATQVFTNQDSYILPNLNFGDYYWRMSAYYEGSDKALVGKVQHFQVQNYAALKPKEPVSVVWTTPEEKSKQYFIEKPELDLSWIPKNRSEDVAQWKLSYIEENAEANTAKNIELKENKFKAQLEKPGRFIASVVAVDKDGTPIGETEKRSFEVLPLPKLPAPRLIPFEGALRSGEDGRTELKWENLTGAKEYRLVVTREGKELANKAYKTSSTNLKNLMPGDYEIKVQAIDQYGRESEEPQVRKLVVPDKSNVRAPTLKKIKVN